MSFDEYVNHISQKYRLAVAISVIKTKPSHLSIDEYLKQLQSKIIMESDPNTTVCSDDFNFDEDNATEGDCQKMPELGNNDRQSDYRSNGRIVFSENNDGQLSQTILNDFVFGCDTASQVPDVEKHSFVISDTLSLLKEGANQTIVNHENLSQLTFCESQEDPTINNVSNNTFCSSINFNASNAINNNPEYPPERVPENYIDTQVTELYTLQGFTQNSHISQTQSEHFVISDKFIRSKDNAKLKDNANELNIQYNNRNNLGTIFGSVKRVQNKEEAVTSPNIAYSKDVEECIQVTDYTQFSNDIQASQDYEIIETGQVVDTVDANENDTDRNEMDIDEKTDSDEVSQERVPFKVLEELNKVRAYLFKKDKRNTEGYSTDSGYRSDSQVRSSFKSSSQLSGAWLNQSGHCLFSYINQAPTGSGDIMNEISQVLGQLIDKLHDEEYYPSFLEELLDTVDSLIRDTHEGDSWAENVLLIKDENVHRLILLNKSKHIIKYSIQNITNILEKLHNNLTQENLCELTHITEMENFSYIFHLLEIFLKRYMKVKNDSSQASTQNSQEDDRFPKRSSLTDLWRKKWNPNYKETSKLQESVTVCVLKACSEILNKIIVECMDGYSLLAYAALQCFNLIQS